MSVRQSVRAALSRHDRVVLAVSGGLDSMVLLDAAAATTPRERLTVATFDHGTGPAASTARTVVEERARALGLEVVGGRATQSLHSEAELRDARWGFLRDVAQSRRAAVCTAHTADDQVETVLMRVMRDAGARGLAGLYASSPVVRPLLRLTRRQLVLYARAQGLSWVEDPSNAWSAYLRNRVRNDLLPAMRRVRPSIDEDLLAVARKAGRWREDVEAYVGNIAGLRVLEMGAGLDVPAEALATHPPRTLAVLWPAIAARAGVAADRRGIARVVDFTHAARVGARIQLAGGWEIVRSRDAFQLRALETVEATPDALTLSDGTRWGDWSFRSAGSAPHDVGNVGSDSWSAWLPVDCPLSVRPWQPGDAMSFRPGTPPRKVKYFLSDAGVTGHQRAGWPVVLAGDQIVWIPGVRLSEAATARSGRPGLPFVCEYDNR